MSRSRAVLAQPQVGEVGRAASTCGRPLGVRSCWRRADCRSHCCSRAAGPRSWRPRGAASRRCSSSLHERGLRRRYDRSAIAWRSLTSASRASSSSTMGSGTGTFDGMGSPTLVQSLFSVDPRRRNGAMLAAVTTHRNAAGPRRPACRRAGVRRAVVAHLYALLGEHWRALSARLRGGGVGMPPRAGCRLRGRRAGRGRPAR